MPGTIWVEGRAGDAVGYAMRGGTLMIRGDVGYRAGVHMKAFGDSCASIVIGGTAGSFLGEYQAGGAIVVLGLGAPEGQPVVGGFCGRGMYGGHIYLRGNIPSQDLNEKILCRPGTEGGPKKRFGPCWSSSAPPLTRIWTLC